MKFEKKKKIEDENDVALQRKDAGMFECGK